MIKLNELVLEKWLEKRSQLFPAVRCYFQDMTENFRGFAGNLVEISDFQLATKHPDQIPSEIFAFPETEMETKTARLLQKTGTIHFRPTVMVSIIAL